MTNAGAGAKGGRPGARTSSANVLADRMAATLVHHEPGWRLPRLTALARRYNVSASEAEAAIEELAARHLVRRLPDGQVYRASSAEYLIPLEGMPGLTSRIDPMGSEITCRSFHVSWRRIPEEIARALATPSDPVCVARLLWTVNGEPAALVTSYLPGLAPGEREDEQLTAPTEPLTALPVSPSLATGNGTEEGAGPLTGYQARAVSIDMRPPPPSVARSLQLLTGQPVIFVIVQFDDPARHTPAALTVVTLRPDVFRIVIETPDGGHEALSKACADDLGTDG